MKIENLKFRAWHKDLEDMTYSFNGYSLDKFIWKIVTYPDMYQLMQFTGLKDKNGKDIYEGDIIKSVEEDDLREIVFSAGAFSAYERGSKTYCTLHHYGTPLIEVVGNIYENTELICAVAFKN